MVYDKIIKTKKEYGSIMKNKKKLCFNLIVFTAIISITFYIIFKDKSIADILQIISSAKKKYILIAIMSMCLYFVCDAINLGRTLKALGEKSNFIKNIKYVLIGFFFSSITPAASGGQPMQVYYMNKEKISVGNSTLALLINLTAMQIVTISTALISVAFCHKYLSSFLIWFFVIGILLNSSALVLLIVSISSRRMTNWLIKVLIKILRFLKIKNIEDKKQKIEEQLDKYQGGAKYIRENRRVIVRTLITAYIQYLLYYSISYWVYRSFGYNESNILKIIALQSILYGTVSGIPSPGAIGVTEGGYLEIFKNVYSSDIISEAMLLNRGINFYLFLVISAIITIVCTINDGKAMKKENEIEEKQT